MSQKKIYFYIVMTYIKKRNGKGKYMKSVLIEEEIHKILKEASKRSGIKIKVLVESGISYYLKHLRVGDSEKTLWQELNERS